ncbi:hypothetical protein ACO03V_13965 [Microbacterium sp. HMH0099]|uniref:hypothetical protein n=1 Tax=Microbacterium sp. HMH0099 TaxID=3414026 RepID=UPI003BF7409F
MVMEAPLSRQGSKVSRTAAASAPIGPAITEIPWTRVDLDLYEVASGGYIVGYVEVVGSIFVALGGPRYDRAVEVAQHLTFHAAVDAVLRWRV